MLTKNQIVELRITDINNEAFGIGRFEDVAIFVPTAAVGDYLRVRIVKVLARYCFGIVEEILEPSCDRIPVDCAVYDQCGGCSLRHITYEAECALKNNWVFQNLSRIGGVDLEMVPLLPSPKVEGYRNKAQYPVEATEEGLAIGFYAKRSHRVVSCKDCKLQPPLFTEILTAVESFLVRYSVLIYDEEGHRGLVRHIYLRKGEVSGDVMLCLVLNGRTLPHAGQFVTMIREKFPMVTSIILNVNREKTNVILGKENILLFGSETITDTLCGVEVALSPTAFYQVNHDAAQLLYETAARFCQLQPTDILVDLYCGAGTIGLSMAGQVKELIGVEVVAPAVENAKLNAKKAGIENARFLCADAGEAAIKLAEEGLCPNVVVIDPPRKGCEPETLQAISRLSPERLVYISCNSATLARDVKELTTMGYRAVKAQAVDLFPRTGHVECVLLLEKQ